MWSMQLAGSFAEYTKRVASREVWSDNAAQDIAEYAAMLAVILVIVVGTRRLIGSQANNVFSETMAAMGS